MNKRGDPWRSRGIVMVAVMLIGGCVLIGVGISNVQHAGQLRKRGVTVTATVVQDHGWGQYAVRVRYLTAAGRQHEGTLDTPRAAGSYPVGSPVTVVYDPASPSTVTLPGSGGSSGWPEIGVGAFLLLMLAALGGGDWLRSRQRRVRGAVAQQP